jgi:conjugative transfer signal peptidase TraF
MSRVAGVVTDSPRIRFAKKLLKGYRYFCYVFAVAVLAGVPIAWAGGVRIVTTPSVPKGLWWVHRGSVERFGFVNTCLPLTLAAYGRQKGYLDEGSCPGRAAPVMKMVIAMPGDRVSVSDKGIAVNGHLIADSLPQAKDHWGHPVRSTVPIGDSTVAAHQYWLLGMNIRSWDSRYYGPVSQTGFLGIGTPVFIEHAPQI